MRNNTERCSNPFSSVKKCKNTDIAVYIYYNGSIHPICYKCWKEIAKSNLEWKYEK